MTLLPEPSGFPEGALDHRIHAARLDLQPAFGPSVGAGAHAAGCRRSCRRARGAGSTRLERLRHPGPYDGRQIRRGRGREPWTAVPKGASRGTGRLAELQADEVGGSPFRHRGTACGPCLAREVHALAVSTKRPPLGHPADLQALDRSRPHRDRSHRSSHSCADRHTGRRRHSTSSSEPAGGPAGQIPEVKPHIDGKASLDPSAGGRPSEELTSFLDPRDGRDRRASELQRWNK